MNHRATEDTEKDTEWDVEIWWCEREPEKGDWLRATLAMNPSRIEAARCLFLFLADHARWR
jgi:hypothetical protein